MRFTASTADLLDALTAPAKAVRANTSGAPPIFQSLLFERTEGGRLRVTGRNLSVAAEATLGVQFDLESGLPDAAAAVPATRFVKTLQALPDLPVTIVFEQDEDDAVAVTLQTDQGRYEMPGHAADDYPDGFEEGEDAERFDVTGEAAARLIDAVSWACSGDSLRPALQGIYLDGPAGLVVATDGHRLARLRSDALGGVEGQVILPQKGAQLVASLARDTETVAFHLGEACLAARADGWAVTMQLVDHDYPDYEAVIPDPGERRLTGHADAFRAATERVGRYASRETKQLRATLNGSIELEADDRAAGAEASESVSGADYEGEEMQIGFNHTYLAEALKQVEGEVEFVMSTPNRAARMAPVEQEEGEDYLVLVMPVMLNTYA